MSSILSPKKPRVFIDVPVTISSVVLEAAEFSTKVLQGLNELRREGVLCDYTLVAENQRLQVHRSVLVACSDYFRAMMTGQLRESKENEVELIGVSKVGLEAVVQFCYTGSIEITSDTLEYILSAASYLQINEAINLCCSFMKMALSINNSIEFLNLSEIYSLKDSKSVCYDYILNNFEHFCDSDQYTKLSNTQLAYMLSQNNLKVLSEYKLFELVLRWINFNLEEREEHVAMLMSNLRLPLLSGEELVDKVSRVELMKTNAACNQLLTEAKDYHIVISKQPMLQSARTQVRSEQQSIVMCHAVNIESYNLSSERHAYLKDAPVPLYSPSVCVVDNFMYVCGGKYDSNENNEIATARCFRYDPRFDSWFELASMNEARKDFVMIAVNNHLYSIAGQDENLVMCTVECFSIENNEWESRADLSHAVYGHAGALCNDRIYVCGGQKFDGHCNKVLSFDSKLGWRDEPPLHNARSNHVVVAMNNYVYCLGGNTEDSYAFPVPITSIERFDTITRTWTICEAVLNVREAGACILDNTIYIVGGINGQHYFSDLIQKYDPEKDRVFVKEHFHNRIYGRACCVLSLPHYI